MDRRTQLWLWSAGAIAAAGIAGAVAARNRRNAAKRLWRTPAVLDPVVLVRESCFEVVNRARHVHINEQKLRELAKALAKEDIEALRQGVEWDEFEWHFTGDAKSGGELTCQYIFVLDALNFCFWPTPGFEYENLAQCLKKVLDEDPTAFEAHKLMAADTELVNQWVPGIPNKAVRAQKLQELGAVLTYHFDGLAMNMVAAANGSARRLVKLIIDHLPGFRDSTVYPGDEGGFQVHFYKRAQILVADLWAAYGKKRDGVLCGFYDMNRLTMFADYRVPQVLRAEDALTYTGELAQQIDSLKELRSGCEEEVEIRAATVIAIEMLQQFLERLGVELMTVEVDWLLWQRGEKQREILKPHHRTRTIFY